MNNQYKITDNLEVIEYTGLINDWGVIEIMFSNYEGKMEMIGRKVELDFNKHYLN